MKFSITDIPQADRLDKVILTAKAVSEGAATDVKIAAEIGFSDRQGRYYRHAAEILGLIKNDRNNATITELGLELVKADTDKKLLILRKAIYKNNFFNAILDFFNSSQRAFSEEEIKRAVLNITDTDAHSTVPRRVKTIISWLSYLDLIVEYDDNYEINANTYSNINLSIQPDGVSNLFEEYLYSSGNKTLQEIKIEDISPNPHNPRLIFDSDDLNDLKKSIDKVGILVPITVYRNKKNFPKTPYILLDGERRWRCAKELAFENIPANVIDEPSDDTQNILYMFNIHHFRKEWALFPTALKLEVVINKLGTDLEKTLSEFTGLTTSTIRRCKILLWYPTIYRDILMEKGGKISTDFFIEIFPIVYRLSTEDEFLFPDGTIKLTNAFIEKFKQQTIVTDVKEFREIRRAMGYYEKTNNFGEFKRLINQFSSDAKIGMEVFASPEIEGEITRKNVMKYISYLNSNLQEINPNLISDLYFVEQLQLLAKNLKELLEKID